MAKLIDLTGQRFGRLTVIERSGTIGKHPAWSCFCDCGNTVIVRGDHLRDGLTKSCRCLETEKRNSGELHLIHGGRKTRIYSIWSGMRKRCENKNCKSFPDYGGVEFLYVKNGQKIFQHSKNGHWITTIQTV